MFLSILLKLRRVHLLKNNLARKIEMKKKIILLMLVNLLITPAIAKTDAVLVNTKTILSGKVGETNSVDTGITIENGDIWIWGFRGSGQQGNGQTGVSVVSKPARVETFVKKGLKIIQSAAGIYHIIALDDKGDVWGWGQNGYSEAGGKVCTSGYINEPCQILKGKKIIQIGAGEYMSYALSKDGDMYAWGHSPYGQVPTGAVSASIGVYQIPRSDFNNKPIVMMGAAYENGYAVNSDGEIYGWGDEENNAFGYDNKQTHIYVLKPKLLNFGTYGKDIDFICGGNAFTEILTSDGTVYGLGTLSMLGQDYKYNDANSKTTDTPVKILSDVRSLYCRFAGSLAFTVDKDLYTWGSNLSNDPYNIYGQIPTKRNYHKNITKIDGAKESLYYWTDQGVGYGIGYGAGFKFSQSSAANVDWPGKELTFVIDAMKEVYGKDYIVGQSVF